MITEQEIERDAQMEEAAELIEQIKRWQPTDGVGALQDMLDEFYDIDESIRDSLGELDLTDLPVAQEYLDSCSQLNCVWWTCDTHGDVLIAGDNTEPFKIRQITELLGDVLGVEFYDSVEEIITGLADQLAEEEADINNIVIREYDGYVITREDVMMWGWFDNNETDDVTAEIEIGPKKYRLFDAKGDMPCYVPADVSDEVWLLFRKFHSGRTEFADIIDGDNMDIVVKRDRLARLRRLEQKMTDGDTRIQKQIDELKAVLD